MSEEFDDYDYEDDDYRELKEKKEVIEGYTVQSSVSIGNKRIIYAKDETEKMDMPYMKCIAIQNSLFTRYEDAMISDSYEEIFKLFGDDIKAEAVILEAENRARQASKLPAFTASELIKDIDECIEGKVVAIHPRYLNDGYKSMPYQLFYITGGNGSRENHYGNACFCNQLYTGKETRIERYEVLGIVPDDKLPDFARKTLEKLKEEKTRKGGER